MQKPSTQSPHQGDRHLQSVQNVMSWKTTSGRVVVEKALCLGAFDASVLERQICTQSAGVMSMVSTRELKRS